MKKIGIIAPSGAVEEIDEKKIYSFFEKFNIEAKIFNSCTKKFRYLAGSDLERASDINEAFQDSSIDTIIAARGGFGAIKILDLIDYELIKKNKKNFIGFSDITILLISFYKRANLATFHGKMAINGILNMDDEEFLNYVSEIENNTFKTTLTGGILWGGNLSSIVSMFGLSFEFYIPDEDIILFIEDINEPDYKIDRMLTQILNNNLLRKKIKGVIFGDFKGSGKYLDEIKMEFIDKLNVNYENNPNIGHNDTNIVLPFGKKF